MHKYLFSIAILSLSLLFAADSYAAQCEGSIQKSINARVEVFTKELSEALASEEAKSDTVKITMNNVRKLKCELEKVCDAIDKNYMASYKEEGKIPNALSPSCALIEGSSYSKEDFEGENAICPSLSTQTYGQSFDDTLAFCKERIDTSIGQSKVMVKTGYQKASKQDDGNYYSAKLLSLTERLKELGDKLHMLAVKIQAVFRQVCKCGG